MKCLGAICGDICGQPMEFWGVHIRYYDLLRFNSNFTDDTVITIAFMDWLTNDENHTEAELIKKVVYWGNKYWYASYGEMFNMWLQGSTEFKPFNSWGNGSGMRTSPIAWYFDNLDDVLKYSKMGAEITHNHEEGVKGAQAIASSIFLARTGHSKDEIKEYVEKTFKYDLNRKIDDMVKDYKFEVSCQKSVPESIICFLESNSVEEAIQNAIYMGGDTDTMADMAGAIAEAYYNNNETNSLFKKCLDKTNFPKEFLEIIKDFNEKLGNDK